MTLRAARSHVIWTAFHFTAPFLLLDIFYLGLHRNLGAAFLQSYWYLTAFYVTLGLTLPLLLRRQFILNDKFYDSIVHA